VLVNATQTNNIIFGLEAEVSCDEVEARAEAKPEI